MSAPRVGTARMGDDGKVEVSYHRLRGVINDSRGRFDLAADTNQPPAVSLDFYPGPLPSVLEPVVDAALIDGGAES